MKYKFTTNSLYGYSENGKTGIIHFIRPNSGLKKLTKEDLKKAQMFSIRILNQIT